MINLKIYEKNNNLFFKENYEPIVCGNSNYEITFEFSLDWQAINNKTALIIANGQKTAIDFSENTLTLPAMPNCNNFLLIVLSSEGETTRLVSSPIEISAVPTTYAESLPEFEPLTTYVSELLTKINNLIDGETKAKLAEKADTATVSENVSNPNLLLNGDFKINQRGKTSYVCTKNEYTLDRWLGANGLTVTKNANSISLTNTNSSGTVIFQQKLEEPFLSFAGKNLCISAEVDGTVFHASANLPTTAPSSATTLASKQIADGVTLQLAYISTNMLSAQFALATGKTITLTNAKLELGSSPTAFCPRLYAEEFALCQRYYQIIKKISGNTSLNLAIVRNETSIRIFVNLLQSLRTTPTIKTSNCTLFNISNDSYIVIENALTVTCLSENQCVLNYTSSNLTRGTMFFVSDTNGLARIELDAEIY